jgi:hypothetical protein
VPLLSEARGGIRRIFLIRHGQSEGTSRAENTLRERERERERAKERERLLTDRTGNVNKKVLTTVADHAIALSEEGMFGKESHMYSFVDSYFALSFRFIFHLH